MLTFERFQPSLFEFLEQLADNNNRPWFQENKGRYERDVLKPSLAFIRAFQPRLKRISPYFVASDRRVAYACLLRYASRWRAVLKTNVGIQFRHELGRHSCPRFHVHIAQKSASALGEGRPDPQSPERSGRAPERRTGGGRSPRQETVCAIFLDGSLKRRPAVVRPSLD
jgi:uncharacterized protein (DUF2461 family)